MHMHNISRHVCTAQKQNGIKIRTTQLDYLLKWNMRAVFTGFFPSKMN